MSIRLLTVSGSLVGGLYYCWSKTAKPTIQCGCTEHQTSWKPFRILQPKFAHADVSDSAITTPDSFDYGKVKIFEDFEELSDCCYGQLGPDEEESDEEEGVGDDVDNYDLQDRNDWINDWDREEPDLGIYPPGHNPDRYKTLVFICNVDIETHNVNALTQVESQHMTVTANTLAEFLQRKVLSQWGEQDPSPTDIHRLVVSTQTLGDEIRNAFRTNNLNVRLFFRDPLFNECSPRIIDCDFLEPLAYAGEAEQWRDHAKLEAAFRDAFFRPVHAHTRQVEVYVSHPKAIKYYLVRALQLNTDFWPLFNIRFGSITVFNVYENGEVKAKMIGATNHLITDD